MALKPQDVLVLLKLASQPEEETWSFARLALELDMSVSEVHAAIKRASEVRLIDHPSTRTLNRHALLEFLEHALKYLCPARRGPVTRGLPTAHSAPPLLKHFRHTADLPVVWPDPQGTVRGEELRPLYRSVPQAAQTDRRLYEWLALADAVRAGRGRERELAVAELRTRLA